MSGQTKVVQVWELPPVFLPATVELADVEASCGFPSPAQDYGTTEIDLNEHLLPNRLSSYVMRVRGNSMTGAGIWDGDEVIVDRSVEVQDGDVVVVSVDGEMLVKRWSVGRDGTVALCAEHPDYPPLLLSELNDVRVWGVITYGLRHVITRRF